MIKQNIVLAITLLFFSTTSLYSQLCNDSIPFAAYSFEYNRCYLKEVLLSYKDTTHLDLKNLFLVRDCNWGCSSDNLENLDIDLLDSEAFIKLSALTSIETPVFIPIPKQIEKLKQLKGIHQYFLPSFYFWLKEKTLPQIPNNLWNLSTLESLTLFTDTIPAEIKNLTHLKYLNIFNLGELPIYLPNRENWLHLKDLNTLILHSASINTQTIASLAPLQSLQLFDLTTKANSNGFIDSCFQILANNANTLKSISLTLNRRYTAISPRTYVEFDDGITQHFVLKTNYPILKKLDLQDCSLKEFAAKSSQIPKVSKLNLSNNRLCSFDLKIDSVSSIRQLDLSHNFLTTLPTDLIQLKHLEFIDLYGNRIIALPIGLEYLPNLKEIILDNKIPPTILEQLQKRFGEKLKINSYNSLEDYVFWMKEPFISFELQDKACYHENERLDKFQFVLKDKSLVKKISLQGNIFSKFPTRILNYKKLLELNISSNLLTNIPTKIKNLKELKSLNLRHNYLQVLPKSFGKLEQLERLDLSFNLLKNLPTGFKNLKNLKYLAVINNPLESLPIELKQLQQIEKIYISNDLDKTLKDLLGEWFGEDKIFVEIKNFR